MEVLKNQKKLIQAIIFISIMLFFGYLPPFGAITEMGMKVLGIFLGCILAWCCGEIVWPSILGLILMGFTGYQTVAGAFSFGFGHTVVWLVVFALIFLHAFTSSNLTDTITKYILSRKFVTKGPWYLAMAFWLVAGFVSLFITITPAVTLVIWTFFYGTCKKVGIKPYSRYATLVLIGICLIAELYACMMPFSVNVLTILGIYNAVMPNDPINLGFYLILGMLLSLIFVPLWLVLCKYVFCRNFELDLSNLTVLEPGEKVTVSTEQKFIMFYTLLLAAVFIAPSFMPATWGITQFINALGNPGCFAIILVLMSLTYVNGKPIIDIVEAMKVTMAWPLFFMLSSAWTISAALVTDQMGVTATILMYLDPILGTSSAYLFAILVLFIGLIMTNCINNVVSMTIMIPIAMSFLPINGANPVVLTTLACLVISQGAILPSGSPLGAIMHGNKEWMTTKDVLIFTTIFVFTLTAVVAFIGYPMGTLIYNMMF